MNSSILRYIYRRWLDCLQRYKYHNTLALRNRRMPRWLRSLLDALNRLFGNPDPPSPPDPPPPPPPSPPSDIAKALLNAHNDERSSRGVSRLRLNSMLVDAAEGHAQWMSNNQTMSHRGENGSSVGTRARNSGYPATAVGENIARGYSTVESVMRGWMNSSGHRSNILRRSYVDCGFAKVGRYWCAVFGAPASSTGSGPRSQIISIQESCPDGLEGSEE
jgi:uncharacterized protein YkwD